MANDVFANGREISCKAAGGKAICAFPDVCFTPPENPATPPGVPVPYPNTGMSSDTTSGSKTVKISGKETMLKNKSYFKKSMGDEAGCAAKKGVVTSVNRGKVYFTAWSMDVKFEGENIVRHLDMTTHNHASFPSNTGPWPYVDTNAFAPGGACEDDIKKEREACKDLEVRFKNGRLNKAQTKKKICNTRSPKAKECRKARKCRLEPHDTAGADEAIGCCEGQEAHHVIEAHGFIEKNSRDNFEGKALKKFQKGGKKYRPGDAPTVCAEGQWCEKQHGAFHALVGQKENAAIKKARNRDYAWNYNDAKKAGSNAHQKIFPGAECSRACIEAQLDAYHKQVGATERSTLRTEKAGIQDWMKKKVGEVLDAMKKQLKRGSHAGASFP